jgi:hypothetical protein
MAGSSEEGQWCKHPKNKNAGTCLQLFFCLVWKQRSYIRHGSFNQEMKLGGGTFETGN